MLPNIDPQEIEKFDNLSWWDATGPFKPLHDLNPIRLQFIQDRISLQDKTILDVGCGGGILTESLAQAGAQVIGIDVSEKALAAAQEHQFQNQLNIAYYKKTAEEFNTLHSEKFDVITCFELLEHVPNPVSLITACAQMLKNDGHLFFSTLNRTLKGYLFAILGAEYLLRLLPKGTHDYAKFIRPSELSAWVRQNSLMVCDLTGVNYNPLTKTYSLSTDINVNYLMHCKKILE